MLKKLPFILTADLETYKKYGGTDFAKTKL